MAGLKGRSRVFQFTRNGITPQRHCRGLYIARVAADPHLFRFGEAGSRGATGSIYKRFSAHLSDPDGKTNGTNEYRPFEPFWAHVIASDSRLVYQSAEGVLGHVLLSRFEPIVGGHSLFRGEDDAAVLAAAEHAADIIDEMILRLAA